MKKPAVPSDEIMRIRRYGILANRTKKEELGCRRRLLAEEGEPALAVKKSSEKLMAEIGRQDLSVCPECKVGRMIIIKDLPEEMVKQVETEGSQRPRMDSS